MILAKFRFMVDTLWEFNIAMENHHAINGGTHYFYVFNSELLVIDQRIITIIRHYQSL